MNLVDSSGWLEYFSEGKNAKFFSKPLESSKGLIVPTICLYEVFKKILQQRGEESALQAVVLMQKGEIVPIDATLSIHAARLSFDLKLPMADSIILATARAYGAILWTQDSDFKDIEGIKLIEKS
jgi:toxin FitB